MSEVWKTVPDFLDYEASTIGRIRSKDRILYKGFRKIKNQISGKVLSPGDSGHYHFVYLYKNKRSHRFYVHRIVMATFVGASDKPVNHINGLRYDNRLENLEYSTPKQNIKHAITSGLIKRKLSHTDVLTIKFFYHKEPKEKLRDSTTQIIAKIYGVDKQTINRIVRGASYQY